MKKPVRLGVNIDHVGTLRNARNGQHPDPVAAAKLAISAGADGITAHLREDRRHIRDDDISRLMREINRPLNLEMAATPEMLAIALSYRPHACCLVPERREELTTEGGLDAIGGHSRLAPVVQALNAASVRVSLFIEPSIEQVRAAKSLQAPVVELHTGSYCEAEGSRRQAHLERLVAAAREAERLGIECHAGHGLTFDTVADIAAIPNIAELNIGHFLVGEAIFQGLAAVIEKMRDVISAARRS